MTPSRPEGSAPGPAPEAFAFSLARHLTGKIRQANYSILKKVAPKAAAAMPTCPSHLVDSLHARGLKGSAGSAPRGVQGGNASAVTPQSICRKMFTERNNRGIHAHTRFCRSHTAAKRVCLRFITPHSLELQ